MTTFIPFDPGTKMAEATVVDAQDATLRVVKGAYAAVRKQTDGAGAADAEHELEAKGFRVLGVALGTGKMMRLMGIIALGDPPRADAGELILELRALGVHPVIWRQSTASWARGWPDSCRSHTVPQTWSKWSGTP